jgi:hypothetical protein
MLCLALAVGCSTPPERRATAQAAEQLLKTFSPRDTLVVVGGIHRRGKSNESAGDEPMNGPSPGPSNRPSNGPTSGPPNGPPNGSTGRAADAQDGEQLDILARSIERELVFALHEHLRLVDQHAMNGALEVLRLQQTDLYQDADESLENIRSVGRFLQAEIFVTGDYELDGSGEIAVDFEAIDINTLELLAVGRGHSMGPVDHALNFALRTGAVITSPVIMLWDVLVEVAETCFPQPAPGLGELVVNWIKVPFYLPMAFFLSDYSATRSWLRLEDSTSAGGSAAAAPDAGDQQP